MTGERDGRTARREVSRERIERAATELFAEQGYVGSTLDDIATAAGVSKGTIFYNYRNKAELFEQLLLAACTTLADEVTAAREGRHGWDAFSAATLRIIDQVDAHPAPALIVLNELFRAGRPWAATLGNARSVLVGPLSDIMSEIAAERLAADPSSQVTAPDQLDHLAMAAFGALVVSALDRQAFEPDRTNADVHQVLLSAVAGLHPALRPAGEPAPDAHDTEA